MCKPFLHFPTCCLSRIILFSGVRSECYCDSVPQFHQLQYSMRLQQSLPLPSPSLAVFPVAGFVVQWQRDTSVGCSDEDEDRVSVNGAFTSYIITGLEPGNRYTITVTVSNSAGSSGVSNTVTAMTEETGERDCHY